MSGGNQQVSDACGAAGDHYTQRGRGVAIGCVQYNPQSLSQAANLEDHESSAGFDDHTNSAGHQNFEDRRNLTNSAGHQNFEGHQNLEGHQNFEDHTAVGQLSAKVVARRLCAQLQLRRTLQKPRFGAGEVVFCLDLLWGDAGSCDIAIKGGRRGSFPRCMACSD